MPVTRPVSGLLFLGIVLAVLASPPPAAAGPEEAAASGDVWITLRILPGARPKTLSYLAEVAEPVRRSVQAGDDLKALLREQYGFFNDALWSMVRQHNPGLSSLSAETDGIIELPAGPVWYFDSTTQVRNPEGLWSQVLLEMGTDGNQTRTEVARANRGFRPNLQEGQEIRLPYATRPVSFALKPELREEAGEILARLRADDDVVHADIAKHLSIIRQFDNSELATSTGSCGQLITDGPWPFDALGLQEALISLPMQNRVTVAVVDSGIAPDDSRLPLWQNLLEVIGEDGEDDDGNRYFDDVVGADVPARGFFPEANVGRPGLREHGTHVAGLVMGGRPSENLLVELRARIQLMILKVLRQIGPLEEVAEDAVSNAILYAASKRAGVVNLSLEGPGSDILDLALRTNKDLLFVVAAGNGLDYQGLDLDVFDVYPAKYGGVQSENLITVAAHDGRGSLTCFSNFSATTVDLAAPGIDIESTVLGNSFGRYNGTSQAAPLVSLTAALLMSQGISEPRLVKQRILSAVDYVRELRGKVVSEGKLNITKTLLIEDDLVQLRDGTLLRGRLEPAPVLLGDKMIPMRRIKKIVFGYSDNPQEAMRVTLLEKGGKLRNVTGPLTIDRIVLHQEGGDLVITVDEVADVVPALRPRQP